MSSFFPWMGGKSRQAAAIVAAMADHKCYVELFAGAANVLFAKPRASAEVINDVDGEVVNLFRVVRYHRREFLNELKLVLHSREVFGDYRTQSGLTDIQRAARSYFIMKAAFGGQGGTSSSPTFGYGTTGRARFSRLAFTAVTRCHKRLDGVFIEHLDFADCISRYDRPYTFFYADPPYLDTAGYKAGFCFKDHQRLAESLSKIKGKFLLSINDHPEIKKLYAGHHIKKIPVRYTVARDKSQKATARNELMISNYKL